MIFRNFITVAVVGYLGTLISALAFLVVLLLCLTDHVGVGAVEAFGALLLFFVLLFAACVLIGARSITAFRDR